MRVSPATPARSASAASTPSSPATRSSSSSSTPTRRRGSATPTSCTRACGRRSRCRGSTASSTPPMSRCCRCSSRPCSTPTGEMRAARAGGPRAPRDAAAGAGRRPRQPLDPRVPDHLRRRGRGGDRGDPRHHRGALLRRLGAARRRRSGPARLPPGADRRPHRGRPDRRLPRRRRLRRQPAAGPGRQQQEADGAARRSPLRPPGRAARGRGDRGDDPLDPGAAAGAGHLRAVDDRPARLRLRQPRPAGAEAGLRVRRPRRRAGDGDRAGRLGPDHRRAGRDGRLHRPGVRAGARGDVPDGRGRPRADAAEALQHQPVRDRRALRGDDHPDLRPGGDQRLGRAAGCCRAWSAATSGVCSPSPTGIREEGARDETRA